MIRSLPRGLGATRYGTKTSVPSWSVTVWSSRRRSSTKLLVRITGPCGLVTSYRVGDSRFTRKANGEKRGQSSTSANVAQTNAGGASMETL
jgi:hypothetical protein